MASDVPPCPECRQPLKSGGLVLSKRNDDGRMDLSNALAVCQSARLVELGGSTGRALGGLPRAGVVPLTSNADINAHGPLRHWAATDGTHACGWVMPRTSWSELTRRMSAVHSRSGRPRGRRSGGRDLARGADGSVRPAATRSRRDWGGRFYGFSRSPASGNHDPAGRW